LLADGEIDPAISLAPPKEEHGRCQHENPM